MHHRLWLGYEQQHYISHKNPHQKYNINTDKSGLGEPKEMGSVDSDGGIAKGDPMKKGENEGSEELEEYGDYYDDLEACDDGKRRACRNAEFCQQLYEDMLVEKKK
jgi:hypothetical protein